jgi:hypothetical protein
MPPRGHAGDNNVVALSLRGWAEEAQAAAGIAKALAPTAFVPDHLRVWTNPKERDSTVAQVSAVLLAGQELEFGPMASLRAFVIIRGTVALFAVAARALLLRHGHEIVVRESTSSRAIVSGRRNGSENWQSSTWDLDRARTAGLYPGHPDGNWRKQTKSMLVARATAEACRWVASDALLGLPLIAEEVMDDGAGMDDGGVVVPRSASGTTPRAPRCPPGRRCPRPSSSSPTRPACRRHCRRRACPGRPRRRSGRCTPRSARSALPARRKGSR